MESQSAQVGAQTDFEGQVAALESEHQDRESFIDALVKQAQQLSQTNFEAADQFYALAEARARETPIYEQGLVAALVRRAFALFRLGQLAPALKLAAEGKGRSETLGDEISAVDVIITTGQIHRTVGNFDEAVEALFEGVERAQRAGLKRMEARACNSLGALFGSLENQEDSLRYFERALALQQDVAISDHAAQTVRANFSNCLRRVGRADEAVQQAQRAVDDCRASGSDQDACYYLGSLAAAQVATGDLEAAFASYAQAQEASPRSPGHPWPDIQQQFAEALLLAGRASEALPVLDTALKISRQLSERPLTAAILKTLSRCHAQLGDYERAYKEELDSQEIKAALGAEGSIERHRIDRILREVDQTRQHSENLEQLVDERTKELQGEVIRRRDAQEALRREAFTSLLTGLPNRMALIQDLGQRLAQCQEKPTEQFGLLFMDLNRFRRINDSLGYARADRVITELASRIIAKLSGGTHLYHLGADEFALVIDKLEDDVVLAQGAARIRSICSRPIQIDERDIHLSMDIGGVIGNASYQQADHVLLDADTAMTRAKRTAKGFQFFNRHMREQAAGQFRLETELRRALKQGEFEVHYQPIIDQRRRCLRGFEALVRWQHPVRGILPAADFVPAAAQLDLLPEIDRWVLRSACANLRKWHTTHPISRGITVSVNLSPQHMAHPSWDDELDELLSEFSDVSGQISLELTEAALMDLGSHQVARLERLRRRGIGWVIDDFGTGYSSLSYLQRLPVDCLKIDRSFVSGLPTGERELRIIAAIVELARALQLETIAEGVEERAQLQSLASMGCYLVQGFLFAPALPSDKASAFLGEVLPRPGLH